MSKKINLSDFGKPTISQEAYIAFLEDRLYKTIDELDAASKKVPVDTTAKKKVVTTEGFLDMLFGKKKKKEQQAVADERLLSEVLEDLKHKEPSGDVEIDLSGREYGHIAGFSEARQILSFLTYLNAAIVAIGANFSDIAKYHELVHQLLIKYYESGDKAAVTKAVVAASKKVTAKQPVGFTRKQSVISGVQSKYVLMSSDNRIAISEITRANYDFSEVKLQNYASVDFRTTSAKPGHINLTVNEQIQLKKALLTTIDLMSNVINNPDRKRLWDLSNKFYQIEEGKAKEIGKDEAEDQFDGVAYNFAEDIYQGFYEEGILSLEDDGLLLVKQLSRLIS